MSHPMHCSAGFPGYRPCSRTKGISMGRLLDRLDNILIKKKQQNRILSHNQFWDHFHWRSLAHRDPDCFDSPPLRYLEKKNYISFSLATNTHHIYHIVCRHPFYGKKSSSTKLRIQLVDPIYPNINPDFSCLNHPCIHHFPWFNHRWWAERKRSCWCGHASHTPWPGRGWSRLTFQLLKLPIQPEQRRHGDCGLQNGEKPKVPIQWRNGMVAYCGFSPGIIFFNATIRKRERPWPEIDTLIKQIWNMPSWRTRKHIWPYLAEGCCVSGSKFNSGRRRVPATCLSELMDSLSRVILIFSSHRMSSTHRG